jgi:hypothetical protein
MVLRLLRALLGAPGFLATVIRAMREHRREISISIGMPGPHDLTVRAGASRLLSPSRPSQPAPTYRDDAYAPLDEAGWRQTIIFSDKTKAKYFPQQGWTAHLR